MCCFCFERVPYEELATDDEYDGKTDVCQPCWDWEQEQMEKRNRLIGKGD